MHIGGTGKGETLEVNRYRPIRNKAGRRGIAIIEYLLARRAESKNFCARAAVRVTCDCIIYEVIRGSVFVNAAAERAEDTLIVIIGPYFRGYSSCEIQLILTTCSVNTPNAGWRMMRTWCPVIQKQQVIVMRDGDRMLAGWRDCVGRECERIFPERRILVPFLRGIAEDPLDRAVFVIEVRSRNFPRLEMIRESSALQYQVALLWNQSSGALKS